MAGTLAALATIASLVVGVISIIPILTNDSSGVGTLESTGRVVSQGVYAVEPGDLVDFPSGVDVGCDPSQRAWLEEMGESVPRTILVEVRNVASEGAIVAVTEVRAEGRFSEPEQAVVLVECSPWDQAGSGKPALLELSDGTIATFDNSIDGRLQGGLPDSPIAYNLAPGETAQFLLTVFGAQDFSGEIVSTVTSGRERVSQPIEIDGLDELRIPGSSLSAGTYLTVVDGKLICARPGLRADEPVFEEFDVCLGD
ncbi:hypothetical protein [Microcella sp.]|uniref:hypothetical protein n=1 Tax=Microcella sp. TaxID=1913979 RepID=UPI00391C75B9